MDLNLDLLIECNESNGSSLASAWVYNIYLYTVQATCFESSLGLGYTEFGFIAENTKQ